MLGADNHFENKGVIGETGMKYFIATFLVILALPAVLLASIVLGVVMSIDVVAEAIGKTF